MTGALGTSGAKLEIVGNRLRGTGRTFRCIRLFNNQLYRLSRLRYASGAMRGAGINVQRDWRESSQNVTKVEDSEKAQQANNLAQSQVCGCSVCVSGIDLSYVSSRTDWSEYRDEVGLGLGQRFGSGRELSTRERFAAERCAPPQTS